MAEYVRESHIDLYIDTNKRTIQKRFRSVEALRQYLANLELHTTLMGNDYADVEED